jgi:hypothetical protein
MALMVKDGLGKGLVHPWRFVVEGGEIAAKARRASISVEAKLWAVEGVKEKNAVCDRQGIPPPLKIAHRAVGKMASRCVVATMECSDEIPESPRECAA